MTTTNYWSVYKLRPGYVLVQFERVSQEKSREVVRDDGTRVELTLPGVWTKQMGSGATAFSVTNERDPITDIARVLAVGPSTYDGNGSFVEQPCAVGDRIWSNRIYGRPVPHPTGEDADDSLRLINFGDVLATL